MFCFHNFLVIFRKLLRIKIVRQSTIFSNYHNSGYCIFRESLSPNVRSIHMYSCIYSIVLVWTYHCYGIVYAYVNCAFLFYFYTADKTDWMYGHNPSVQEPLTVGNDSALQLNGLVMKYLTKL